MIDFSADIEFEVFSDGRAKVVEKKHAQNHTDKLIEVNNYFETLPTDVALDSIKCYSSIGEQNIVELKKDISTIHGTDRKRITISNKDGSSIKLHPGKITVTTEFIRDNFFFFKGKVYGFYLHYSLPKIDYIKNVTVAKTIKLKIHKPFSRFLYSYSLYSIHQPFGFNKDLEINFDKFIEMEFKFNLNRDSHYFNTIFILKNFRIPHINLISHIIKQLLKSKGIT